MARIKYEYEFVVEDQLSGLNMYFSNMLKITQFKNCFLNNIGSNDMIAAIHGLGAKVY